RLSLASLVFLILGEVEVGFVVEDVGPAQVVACCGVEFFESRLICCEVDQHVAVGPVSAAAMLSRLMRKVFRARFGAAFMSDFGMKYDESCFIRIWDVAVRFGADVHAGKIAAGAALTL